MAANNNMLNLKHRNRKLKNRETIEIRVTHDIGDVTVDKDLSGW
eukprot:CAMPEP_0184684054 /NCGR_PEP_ID=MMETSP0312-20130426/13614_1 /TAXON_ID=31354 /ORGANISM="Compsopogon coeruleus, Strain SAG 36.94" /LENGTH=43 /DNA_ID= /DNA_START= /DNA_END= /DNA_ORIENTATION=